MLLFAKNLALGIGFYVTSFIVFEYIPGLESSKFTSLYYYIATGVKISWYVQLGMQ
jgi:hypothetical protein